MKLFLSLCFLVGLAITSFAQQQMSVKRFERMPNDLDARVNEPKKDPDGNLCAILKVLTNQTGFSFDNGQIGVVATVQKPSEIWVYVPRETKRLTISHPYLGSVRNYIIPVSIEKATVYEMELIMGSVVTTVKPLDPVFLTIRSTPEGADVYVNEVLKGSTPCSVKLLPGKHTYRIEKVLFQPEAGSVIISGQEKDGKIDKSFVLRPAFGTIKINTLPVQGATVFLDNEETGKITPFTMTKVKSGMHRITVKKDLFQPQNIEVIVKDGETVEKMIKLTTNASNVTINAQNDADIYIDGKYVAKGNYQGLIPSGVVTFEAKKDGYYPDKKNQDIAVGDTVIVNLMIQPIVGRLEVVSTPIDAVVFLNGEKKGTTPLALPNLMVGKYELRLEKEGFYGKLNEINVLENKTTEIDEKLVSNQVSEIQPVVPNSKDESVKSQASNPVVKQDEKPTKPLAEKLPYNSKYYKYKKGKNFWLTSTIVGAAVGGVAYWQAGKKYAAYQIVTTDAASLHQKADLFNKISPIAFGVAALSAIEFISKSAKQGAAKRKTLSLYPQRFDQGAGLGLICKF